MAEPKPSDKRPMTLNRLAAERLREAVALLSHQQIILIASQLIAGLRRLLLRSIRISAASWMEAASRRACRALREVLAYLIAYTSCRSRHCPKCQGAAARAEQAAMPVVGFLHSGSPGGMAFLVTAFRNGLKEAGYIEGRDAAASRKKERHRRPAR